MNTKPSSPIPAFPCFCIGRHCSTGSHSMVISHIASLKLIHSVGTHGHGRGSQVDTPHTRGLYLHPPSIGCFDSHSIPISFKITAFQNWFRPVRAFTWLQFFSLGLCCSWRKHVTFYSVEQVFLYSLGSPGVWGRAHIIGTYIFSCNFDCP